MTFLMCVMLLKYPSLLRVPLTVVLRCAVGKGKDPKEEVENICRKFPVIRQMQHEYKSLSLLTFYKYFTGFLAVAEFSCVFVVFYSQLGL